MVFESFLNYKNYNHPFFIFIMGVFYSSFSVLFSYLFFQKEASYFIVFFTAFMSFHFMYTTIKYEESYDLRLSTETKILKRHYNLIVLFLILYIGFFVGFTVWNSVLPESEINKLFSEQQNSIHSVNQKIIMGDFSSSNNFVKIFFHNIQVLVFVILFSFLFGAGAIFILSWNASVGGVFIGEIIRNNLLSFSAPASVIIGLVRYLPHAVFEFSGYFTAALAGGIISVSLIKHDFMSDKFYKILYDVSSLLFISVLLIMFGAFVEVFITPFLFSSVINLFSYF